MPKKFFKLRRFLSGQNGVESIEYALIAASIALAVVADVDLVGQELPKPFEKVVDGLNP